MKNIIILLFSILVIACGGGGGGSAETTTTPTTDPNTTFPFPGDLSRLPNVGDTETWNLTGATDTGEAVSISMTIKNSGKIPYNGIDVNVIDVLGNVKIPSRAIDVSTIYNYYYDDNGVFVRSFDTDTGTICSASGSVATPPSQVKVGDFGSLTPQSCNDGETSSATWKVEGIDSANVNIIISETTRDSLGELSVTSTTKLKINTSGVVSDVELDAVYYVSGSIDFSISLTGTIQ